MYRGHEIIVWKELQKRNQFPLYRIRLCYKKLEKLPATWRQLELAEFDEAMCSCHTRPLDSNELPIRLELAIFNIVICARCPVNASNCVVREVPMSYPVYGDSIRCHVVWIVDGDDLSYDYCQDFYETISVIVVVRK